MALKLYNTLGRKIQTFSPLRNKKVRLYSCGPTVYGSQHIGNHRTYLFVDMLKRLLIAQGYTVNHITNVTDVGHLVSDADSGEDKVELEARKTHKRARVLARLYEGEFKKDLKALNILRPSKLVRASDHIGEQIRLIKILEKKGYTYRISDGIYFDSSKFKKYGALAPLNIKGIRSGIRVKSGEKRHATDFALWKFSPKDKKREMEWVSPWGIGFPGWHIECSAMALRYLGPTLDIHVGGEEHINIHHTNEIAQSEAATNKKFSSFWLHTAHLTFGGKKMSRSLPETNITLNLARKRGFEPLDIRYFLFGAHYRKPLSFSWAALENARNARLKLIEMYKRLPPSISHRDDSAEQRILDALSNDINVPRALSYYHEAFSSGISKSRVKFFDSLFGLQITKKENPHPISSKVSQLVRKREDFRKLKKWQKADEVRESLKQMGFAIDDTPDGPVIHTI